MTTIHCFMCVQWRELLSSFSVTDAFIHFTSRFTLKSSFYWESQNFAFYKLWHSARPFKSVDIFISEWPSNTPILHIRIYTCTRIHTCTQIHTCLHILVIHIPMHICIQRCLLQRKQQHLDCRSCQGHVKRNIPYGKLCKVAQYMIRRKCWKKKKNWRIRRFSCKKGF